MQNNVSHTRFADNKSLLRKQQISFILPRCSGKIATGIRNSELMLDICPHIRRGTRADLHPNDTTYLVLQILEQDFAYMEPTCYEIQRCQYCWTEFQIESRPLEEGTMGIPVTI